MLTLSSKLLQNATFGPGYFASAGSLLIGVLVFSKDSLLFSQLSAPFADSKSMVFMFSKVLGSRPSRGSLSLQSP